MFADFKEIFVFVCHRISPYIIMSGSGKAVSSTSCDSSSNSNINNVEAAVSPASTPSSVVSRKSKSSKKDVAVFKLPELLPPIKKRKVLEEDKYAEVSGSFYTKEAYSSY